MGLQFLFMDDDAPCHRAVAAEQLLESRRLAARSLPPVTIQELRLALQDEWAAMPQQLIDTLILSKGRRCETCLAVRGIISPTKDPMFLAGHPSQGCFGLQSHSAPCYFFNQASFYPSDFSFTSLGTPGTYAVILVAERFFNVKTFITRKQNTFVVILCAYAREWANNLAATDSFKHRTERKYGENIFMKWSSDPNHVITDGDRFNSCQVIYSQFALAIHQNDHQARRRFVEWAQKKIAVVPDFHKRILFSDEAHSWLNGYVNKQNCRIWSEANPQVYVETPLHPEHRYIGALYGLVESFFKNDVGHNELWFQQDGATCHTARATIDLLKDTCGDRLIARFGPVNWPPRSCDLTPLNYFLWGYVKSLVYADTPQTLDHLEDNIRRVIADIRPQMLEKVIENWTSRLDYIRASCGSHMTEIIFKIPIFCERRIRWPPLPCKFKASLLSSSGPAEQCDVNLHSLTHSSSGRRARFLGGQTGVALQLQDARVGVVSTKKPTAVDVSEK
ncbi:transposable element Tcb2 transposase [Trichonephila clavipes]|nr:transposable element Tcb2 transposase [Trichonephila clavipes]